MSAKSNPFAPMSVATNTSFFPALYRAIASAFSPSASIWSAQIRQASATLVDTPWRIEHPHDWPEAERIELLARLVETSSAVPEFSAQTGITAGLRICAGDACVDGTRRGLLRSRKRIEGIMLAKLNDCRSDIASKINDDDNE